MPYYTNKFFGQDFYVHSNQRTFLQKPLDPDFIHDHTVMISLKDFVVISESSIFIQSARHSPGDLLWSTSSSSITDTVLINFSTGSSFAFQSKWAAPTAYRTLTISSEDAMILKSSKWSILSNAEPRPDFRFICSSPTSRWILTALTRWSSKSKGESGTGKVIHCSGLHYPKIADECGAPARHDAEQ